MIMFIQSVQYIECIQYVNLFKYFSRDKIKVSFSYVDVPQCISDDMLYFKVHYHNSRQQDFLFERIQQLMSAGDEFYLDCNNYIPLTSGISCTSALNVLVDKNSYSQLSLSING